MTGLADPVLLRIAVLLAALGSLGALVFQVLRTHHAGRRAYRSAPRANAGRGIVYAFTTGMMPWEKESAGRHLPTFVGGIFYHAGIFAFLIYVLSLVLFPDLSLPAIVFRVLMSAGLIAGLGLLTKRIRAPHLRLISCPDDYASNALVDVCLMLAIAHGYFPQVQTLLFVASFVLFVYVPIGKIRHCFFFFYTRILFGEFFGRRGVFPSHKVEF